MPVDPCIHCLHVVGDELSYEKGNILERLSDGEYILE